MLSPRSVEPQHLSLQVARTRWPKPNKRKANKATAPPAEDGEPGAGRGSSTRRFRPQRNSLRGARRVTADAPSPALPRQPSPVLPGVLATARFEGLASVLGQLQAPRGCRPTLPRRALRVQTGQDRARDVVTHLTCDAQTQLVEGDGVFSSHQCL